MSTGIIMRTGLIVIGVFIMALSFVLHAKRRLTVNLAVVWEFVGIALILTGAVPVFSSWCYLLAKGTVIAMFVVGAFVLWGCYEVCILISLLNQENELLLNEMKKKQKKDNGK